MLQKKKNFNSKSISELIELKNLSHFGIPYDITCFDILITYGIIAFGTSKGLIKIIGKPGIEKTIYNNSSQKRIDKITFLGFSGIFITISHLNNNSNNSNNNDLVFDDVFGYQYNYDGKSLIDESKPKKFQKNDSSILYVWSLIKNDIIYKIEFKEEITSIFPDNQIGTLYIGKSNGQLQTFSLETQKISDFSLKYSDFINQNDQVLNDSKEIPSLISISINPKNSTLLLIGFSNGLIVLYNLFEKKSQKIFNIEQKDLCSLCWCYNGSFFLSGHLNGQVKFWNLNSCKSFKNLFVIKPEIERRSVKQLYWTESFKPYNTLGDIYLLGSTIKGKTNDGILFVQNNKKDKWKVLDVITSENNFAITQMNLRFDIEQKYPISIISISSGGEIFVHRSSIENVNRALTIQKYRKLENHSNHRMLNSPITSHLYFDKISNQFYQIILQNGFSQKKFFILNKFWPIQGGKILNLENNDNNNNILFTGHHDGTIKMWDFKDSNLQFLSEINIKESFHNFQKSTGIELKLPSSLTVSSFSILQNEGIIGIGCASGEVFIFQFSSLIEKEKLSSIIYYDRALNFQIPKIEETSFQLISIIYLHQNTVTQIEMSSNPKRIVCGDHNGISSIIDLDNFKLLNLIGGEMDIEDNYPIKSIIISSSKQKTNKDSTIIIGKEDGSISIFSTLNGEMIKESKMKNQESKLQNLYFIDKNGFPTNIPIDLTINNINGINELSNDLIDLINKRRRESPKIDIEKKESQQKKKEIKTQKLSPTKAQYLLITFNDRVVIKKLPSLKTAKNIKIDFNGSFSSLISFSSKRNCVCYIDEDGEMILFQLIKINRFYQQNLIDKFRIPKISFRAKNITSTFQGRIIWITPNGEIGSFSLNQNNYITQESNVDFLSEKLFSEEQIKKKEN
ncbi:lethal 2 giant larvae protein [Anaeramoeba ignava]|uniref:Lethal 2 giant larvae protein n=2 Tax=Anaeramoeba ignava TaxID=1746090 RepID=A0A9Q0RFR9_ANAIG|nr:lethal 2 giant larvae protein [Anaeramoeba ignava]